MGVRIGIGFVVVLILMVALSASGLQYVAEANQRLKDIAQQNNVKIELAMEMHSALRERALSMHALPILADPFDKDAEIQRFNSRGGSNWRPGCRKSGWSQKSRTMPQLQPAI